MTEPIIKVGDIITMDIVRAQPFRWWQLPLFWFGFIGRTYVSVPVQYTVTAISDYGTIDSYE